MTETKTIEDGYEVRRDETGKLCGWRQLSGDGPRPAMKVAPAISTKSAPVGPVFTFRETRNPDGTIGAEKVDAAGNVVARLTTPPAGEIIESTDIMGNPPLALVKNLGVKDRKTEGNDFARAVDAFDDADELEIA